MTKASDKRNIKSSPATWSPLARTAVVWLLLALVFLIFHFFYYPRYREQFLAEPEQFLKKADQLIRKGEKEEAWHVLRQGIATFNPPHADAYRMCAALLGPADSDEKSFLEGRAAFYDFLSAPSLDGLKTLQEQDWYAPFVSTSFKDAVSVADDSLLSLWKHFSRALRLPTPSEWSGEEAAALFSLGGSIFSTEGKIGSTAVTSPVPLLAYSGGGADERRGASFFINGRDYGNNKRGIHVALLDISTGELLAVEVFDLWERHEEGRRLDVFLKEAPEPCTGMFAVCDDGSGVLTHDLEESLLLFGLDRLMMEDRRARVLTIRASFAAIGVKGATPGSALQVWSPQYFGDHRGHPLLCAVLPEGSPS
ncbi:MAG: hypothetical protein GX130_01270 [Candidatus Hydrogenedens sp.]|nr:hypothetical protein [Candidatus Hydrogenedens sp.]